MLIAVAISVVILTAAAVLLNVSNLARAQTQSRIQSGDAARSILQLLERDLACAYPGPWTPYAKGDLVTADALVKGSIIKMVTSGEDPALGIRIVCVRYYVLASTGHLYRETAAASPPLEPPDPPYDTDPFAGLFAPPANPSDFAFVNNVDKLEARYLRWDEILKKFVADPPTAQATHLEITLTCLDPNERLPERRRFYQRVMPIPAGFKF